MWSFSSAIRLGTIKSWVEQHAWNEQNRRKKNLSFSGVRSEKDDALRSNPRADLKAELKKLEMSTCMYIFGGLEGDVLDMSCKDDVIAVASGDEYAPLSLWPVPDVLPYTERVIRIGESLLKSKPSHIPRPHPTGRRVTAPV